MSNIIHYLSHISILAIILFIIAKIFEFVLGDFYSHAKEEFKSRVLKDYSWSPQKPFKNECATKNIKEHGKDIKLDFYSKQRRLLNEYVEGQDAFIQHLTMFIATPKDVYRIYEGTNWGNEQALTIFSEQNITEFQRQCEHMANCIIAHEHFKDYIQEIYSIKRKKDCIYIEMKLNGNPKTVTCKIPDLNNKK